MPSRKLLSPSPKLVPTFTRTKLLFLFLCLSSSVVIALALLYLLYHFYYSLLNRTRTIPFDSGAPLKLRTFSYRELKSATADFTDSNIIGKGGSGTVFKGLLRDGKSVAVKVLDVLSLETEREFQNEIQILGGLRSPFLVTLLGYCVEKDKRILVYEYMPNRSLQESIFSEPGLSWEKRFSIVLDVARALEFLHLGCDPPVIHGDVKPSNVLLDSDFRAKVSDFGLSRLKLEGEFGVDFFSQDFGRSQELWKSQELSGALATPVERLDSSSPQEVDFALALQASSSSKTSRASYNIKALSLSSANYNANIAGESDNLIINGGIGKGKEVSVVDVGCEDWNAKFVPYDEEQFGFNSVKDVKNPSPCSNPNNTEDKKQWGKDWWWKQDGSGELCSKDYVAEWIGSQICPSSNPNWDDDDDKNSVPEKTEVSSSTQLESRVQDRPPKGENNPVKRHRKMQDWWKDEQVEEKRAKKKLKGSGFKLRNLGVKWKRGFKLARVDLGRRFYLFRRRHSVDRAGGDDTEAAEGEFSFRKGWKNNKKKTSPSSINGSDDLFSRELSSTTSMRGTLCYVAPEFGFSGYLLEKADVYSFGVLVLVIVSGRRPLHVLPSPMKLEKANLVNWCKQLGQSGDVLELVDERLKGEFGKEQAAMCIKLALACLQKMPELRPDIGEIVRVLKGEIEVPPVKFEFSPSPNSSKLFGKSRRKQKSSVD